MCPETRDRNLLIPFNMLKSTHIWKQLSAIKYNFKELKIAQTILRISLNEIAVTQISIERDLNSKKTNPQKN